MRCPHCEAAKSKIVDSRKLRDAHGLRVRRRRQCARCQKRFTTYEFTEVYPEQKFKPLPSTKPRKKTEKKAEEPKKKTDWLERINRMLEKTETAEKVIRGEL
jgi:transcriptional regulator NrdR family protein